MLRLSAILLAAMAGATLFTPTWAAAPPDFERDVAPLLVRSCLGCHNGSELAGGLNLTQRCLALAAGESDLPAIVAGDPQTSNLVLRVRAGEMPPEGKGKPLTPAELATLEAWIRAGALWPDERVLSPFELTTEHRAGGDWWSLKRPVQPPLPRVRHIERVRTPIDAFVLAQLEEQRLSPAEEVDRATFIRRASLDLLGLPPTRAEIEAFVADKSPDAYEQLIDRLLASPRYGERWARHWLDVVRFGESNGYETNTARTNAWPYRDWVIQALNNDLPYPQFVLAQLAGDQVGEDAATGFLVAGAHDVVASPDIELTAQQRLNDLDDMLSTTATAFLGLTVGCAKCHDHKFDPIAQREYYALQAMFAGVQHGQRELRTAGHGERMRQRDELQTQITALEAEMRDLSARHQPLARVDTAAGSEPLRPAVNALLNVDRFAPVQARRVRFTVFATNQYEPCIDELEIFTPDENSRNVALASAGAKATSSSNYAGGASSIHQLVHINDGRYGNGRSWISAEQGGGWVQIELPETMTIERVLWARDREGVYRDRLATRYKIEVADSDGDWHVVATSDDRRPFGGKSDEHPEAAQANMPAEVAARLDEMRARLDSLQAQADRLKPVQIYAGTFKQAEPIHLLYRGEPLQKREQISPGTISAVGFMSLPDETPEAERRVQLARWIAGRDNPLAARVMVNRIWHYHFGQGLVKSPSDFGFHGGLPSHPELLDWLAVEFMESGWRPKTIHRLIMLSHTYRQASTHNAENAARDADNRLLWRFAPRRLEAEPIRDAMLWASGSLDLRMGGAGYEVFEPNDNYVKVYNPKQQFGPAEWRRMVYQNKPRMRQDATFGEFDCPDSSQTMPRRNVSTTALQALNLLNGPFVLEQSTLFAQRLQREAGENPAAQVEQAFWLAFGRAPGDAERAAGQKLVAEQGLLVFCRALFNANEFLYLP